jgi:hypothetical protein
MEPSQKSKTGKATIDVLRPAKHINPRPIFVMRRGKNRMSEDAVVAGVLPYSASRFMEQEIA